MNPKDIMNDAIHNFHPQYQQYTQYTAPQSGQKHHTRQVTSPQQPPAPQPPTGEPHLKYLWNIQLYDHDDYNNNTDNCYDEVKYRLTNVSLLVRKRYLYLK